MLRRSSTIPKLQFLDKIINDDQPVNQDMGLKKIKKVKMYQGGISFQDKLEQLHDPLHYLKTKLNRQSAQKSVTSKLIRSPGESKTQVKMFQSAPRFNRKRLCKPLVYKKNVIRKTLSPQESMMLIRSYEETPPRYGSKRYSLDNSGSLPQPYSLKKHRQQATSPSFKLKHRSKEKRYLMYSQRQISYQSP